MIGEVLSCRKRCPFPSLTGATRTGFWLVIIYSRALPGDTDMTTQSLVEHTAST